jgi:tetratricopeptide (TPR) repeat protein
MPVIASPWRLPLLAAALLSACAAGGGDGSPGQREGSAFGAYLAGRFAAAETDTTVAADNLLYALRLDPDLPEVRSRAFIATLLDGRADAVRLARQLPENFIANLLLAGGDVQAGRWDRAEQRYRQVGRAGPLAALQPVMLAWVQLGRGNPDVALNQLRPLVDQNRLRALNALHSALIADIAGRPREAERNIRLALADQPEPSLRLATLASGVLARAGRPQDAQRLLEGIAETSDDAALAAAPSNRQALFNARGVAGPADGIAEAYVALAAALRAQAQPDLALILAQLALRLRPGFAPALILAADVVSDQNHDDAALRALDQVAAEDPLAGVVALRRAILLDRVDRAEEGIALLRRLAERYPAQPQPMARLGDLLRHRERFAEAAAAYDAAVQRKGTLRARDWPLLYSRGIARERSDNWAGAERDLMRALELAPDQPLVLNYLGYTWADKGVNLERAKAMLVRATELRPQDGNIADSLGWVLYRLGDMRGAVTWLEKAVELEPRSSVINDHLGDAYWAVGRRREARFQWRRALTTDPEAAEIPKIEAKLRDGLAEPARR